MLLAIDAGNTNVVFAVHDGTEWRGRWRIATDPDRTSDEYAVWLLTLMQYAGLRPAHVRRCVIGTVVPVALYNLRRLCRDWFGNEPLIARSVLDWGFEIKVDQPQEVGADLLRLVHLDLEAPIQHRARDQRLIAEPVAAQAAQIVERHRDDRADDAAPYMRRAQAGILHQRQQPDGVFVARAVRVGGDAPTAAPFRTVMHGEDNIGVAGINREKHRVVPSPRPHGRHAGIHQWRG